MKTKIRLSILSSIAVLAGAILAGYFSGCSTPAPTPVPGPTTNAPVVSTFDTNLVVAIATPIIEGGVVAATDLILAKTPADRPYFVDVQAGLNAALNTGALTTSTLSNILNQAAGTNAAQYQQYTTLILSVWNGGIGSLVAAGIGSQWWLEDSLTAILNGLNAALGPPAKARLVNYTFRRDYHHNLPAR